MLFDGKQLSDNNVSNFLAKLLIALDLGAGKRHFIAIFFRFKGAVNVVL